MAARHNEAQAASETRLFSRLDFLDLDAVLFNAAGEGIEIGSAPNLEPRVVHARLIGLAQNDAVAVKLVPGPQVNSAIRLAADLVQPDAIDIMLECSIQVSHPDLDIAGPPHTFQRHGCLLFGLMETTRSFSMGVYSRGYYRSMQAPWRADFSPSMRPYPSFGRPSMPNPVDLGSDNRTNDSGSPGRASGLNVVVSRPRKLDQIEAIPKWISYISHAPIFADLYFTVERGPEIA